MKKTSYIFSSDLVLSKLKPDNLYSNEKSDIEDILGNINTNETKPSEVTQNELPFNVEVIASNLYVPWAIAISDDGKIYFTERSGVIRVIENGKLHPSPLITFKEPFISQGEGGLLGIALDPNFSENHYLYVMHTYKENNRLYNRVIRLIEQGETASIDSIIIDQIPGSNTHNGGRIKIGPDQKLYIATGDAGNPSLPQDLASTAGKILRLNLDGSIPDDNPITNSPIYSFGFRNPQGLTFGENNLLYATDHGSLAHDEVNIILPGANYGWPLVEGNEDLVDVTIEKPLISSERVTWAPSGIAYANQGPWSGRLLVANLAGRQLLTMLLNQDKNQIINTEAWLKREYGRLREVIFHKDGSIYLTTSNMDGRGFPGNFDDRIIRLTPKESIE